MKNLTLIACVSADLGLGKDGTLLWQLKPDMQFFRQTTSGHVVVMGSNTYRSIGRPLPNRDNIVLSRSELADPGIKVFHDRASLDHFLAGISEKKFIIGGASLYQMYLDVADKLLLTEVQGTKTADVFFPEFDKSQFARKVLQDAEYGNVKFQIVEYTRRMSHE